MNIPLQSAVAAPLFPRTYRFDSTSFTVVVEDAVAPCPAGAVCIWSGIVTQSGTWSVVSNSVQLTYDGDTTNGFCLVYYKQLEPGKFSNTRGFQGRAQALAEIAESRTRAVDTGYA